VAFGHDIKSLEKSYVQILGTRLYRVVVILGLMKTMVAIALGRAEEVMAKDVYKSSGRLSTRHFMWKRVCSHPVAEGILDHNEIISDDCQTMTIGTRSVWQVW